MFKRRRPPQPDTFQENNIELEHSEFDKNGELKFTPLEQAQQIMMKGIWHRIRIKSKWQSKTHRIKVKTVRA
jgi:hypothetical protein